MDIFRLSFAFFGLLGEFNPQRNIKKSMGNENTRKLNEAVSTSTKFHSVIKFPPWAFTESTPIDVIK